MPSSMNEIKLPDLLVHDLGGVHDDVNMRPSVNIIHASATGACARRTIKRFEAHESCNFKRSCNF